jgi:tetratricopeptide (TPR) repeat protein
LLERAGGNPLYAEQFARLFLEHGSVDAVQVPENVQGIIAARLDALPPEEKTLLQDAAVLGKVFWSGGVATLTGFESETLEDALHALVRKGFVRRERRSAVAGESEFAFRHVLVREVGYGQVPRPARVEKHVAAAEWVESLGREEDHAELLAHHYGTALELAEAAGQPTGDLAERTRLALRRAGDRAAALSSYGVAAGFYRSALDLSPDGDPERPALLFALGRAEFHNGDADAGTLHTAANAALAAELPELAAEAEALAAEAAWYRGERDDLTKRLSHARELVEPLPDSLRKAWILSQASRYAMLAGEHDEAIELGRRALAMATALDLPEVRVHALNNVGSARSRRGDLGGIEDLEASAALAEEINSPELARALNNLASMTYMRGEVRKCLELELRSLAVAERFGLGTMLLFSRANVLGSLHRLGMWDEFGTRVDDLLADSPPAGTEASARTFRALIRVARGDLAGAREDSGFALDVARRADEPQAVFPTLSTHGYVLHALGEDDDARKVILELVELLEAAGPEIPFVAPGEVVNAWLDLVGRDRLKQVLRTRESETKWLVAARTLAGGELERALELYRELESVPDIALLHRLNAEHLLENGRRAEANAHLAEALAHYRSLGATHFIREAERLLPASA